MIRLISMVILYATTLATMIGLDIMWLAFFARDFYSKYLLSIRGTTTMMPTPLWIAPGLIVWATMAAGLIYFVVVPTQRLPLWRAIIEGGILGAMLYTVYDFTNYMLIPHWSLILTIVDIAWGTTLLAITAGIAHSVALYTSR
jgi:uncharacterized membrane protein